jgi:hypothetical protein
MCWLVALLLGNSTFLTSSAILLGLGRLDGAALIVAAFTGMLVGLIAARLVERLEGR